MIPSRLPRLSIWCISPICAVLGFSYALATSSIDSRGVAEGAPGIAPRTVSGQLQFTDPPLLAGTDPAFPNGGGSDGFDLGDACDKAKVVRYIGATGGFQPYTFRIESLLDGFNTISSNPPALPSMSLSGKLFGLANSTSVPLVGFRPALRFNVSLTDFLGSSIDGTFRLNLLPCTAAEADFRFAQDRLPSARQGQHYFTSINTLTGPNNELEPVRYANASTTRIEDSGLSLGTDGILFGRPVSSGVIGLTVKATAKTGFDAFSRDGSVKNQSFQLNVTQTSQVTTELAALKCSIRGVKTKAGNESFKYNGLLDLKGETLSTLAGATFRLRIDSAIFEGELDGRGRVNKDLPGKGRFTVALKTDGRITMALKAVDLATPLGVSGFTPDPAVKGQPLPTSSLVLGLEIISHKPGTEIELPELSALRTSEVLNMGLSIPKDRYTLDYAIGKRGSSVGGAFQVISVQGTDGRLASSTPQDPVFGDRWIVRFIALPRSIDGTAAEVVGGASNVTIRIGTSFSQTVRVALKQVRLEFKGTGEDPGIFRVLLSPVNYIHRVETNVIESSGTDIPAAIDTKTPTVYPFGIDFGNFKGDNGRVIVPSGGKWTDRGGRTPAP